MAFLTALVAVFLALDVDDMAREHAGDAPVASAAAQAAPAAAIRGESVVYARLGDTPVSGYLARPAGPPGPLPGVIVIHEWWGLNDNIRAMAERLAGEGYAALAVDLYEGEVAQDPARARTLARASVDERERLAENLRQARAFLADDLGAPRIGSIGWCFGGGWSLQTGLLLPGRVDATVIYYGRLVTDAEQLQRLESPILGIFGALDRGIPVASVREFETALRSAGKPAEIHVYEDADHAFANPSGSRYKADAAEDAWAKTLAFLDEHLR